MNSLWLCLMRGISAPISSLYLSVPDGAMHLQMNVPKAMGTALWIGVRPRRSVVSAAAPFYLSRIMRSKYTEYMNLQ